MREPSGQAVGVGFGELRSAVHEVRSMPERMDVVVWLVLSAQDHEAALRYAQDSLAKIEVGHVNLATLLGWMSQAQDVLMARLKEHGADHAISLWDVREWLSGFAWLAVKAQGHSERIITPGFQSNWLCRSPRGETSWYAIGMDDSRSKLHRQDISYALLRPWVYKDQGEESDAAQLYRVCCLGRDEQWPGLPFHLGYAHEWNNCWPYEIGAEEEPS